MPELTDSQKELLQKLGTDYYNGKAIGGIDDYDSGNDGSGGTNRIRPPVDCPKWVCCLLPCLKFVPSMKLFQSIQPEDAEVLREGGEWVVYEASSVTLGDILRIREGDRVPADCVVLSLGNHHYPPSASASSDDQEEQMNKKSNHEELVVDESDITGRSKPVTIKPETVIAASSNNGKSTSLHYGSQILHGVAIVVVTGVGSQTKLATLMKQGKWPPCTSCQCSTEDEHGDEEAGLSLLTRTV
jgi:hypothetical protein